MKTIYNIDISDKMVTRKLGNYVNQFYKILPIKESGETTLNNYMKSLMREMLGCKKLICALNDDPQYLTLLAILQHHIDEDCDVATVKSDVFKAINIIKSMQKRYAEQNGGDADGRVGKV